LDETLIARINRIFGWQDGFLDGLFFRAENALRFELGGDIPMGPNRFLQAIDRARAIADAAFSGSEELSAVIHYVEEENAPKRSGVLSRKLRKFGFDHPLGPANRVHFEDQDYTDTFGVSLVRCWREAKFNKDTKDVTALLWSSISSETPIAPRMPWFAGCVHIVDFGRGIALWVYDDRGMDLVATSRDVLLPIYERFQTWLYAPERSAMDSLSAHRQ
jgi:hypothetical protein